MAIKSKKEGTVAAFSIKLSIKLKDSGTGKLPAWSLSRFMTMAGLNIEWYYFILYDVSGYWQLDYGQRIS